MRLRVLIFEDNGILGSTLELRLNDRGYEVCRFSDSGICPLYAPYDHSCPLNHACADIIISDVNMHAQAGLELIKDLLQRRCKIEYRALISGDWSDSEVQYVQKLGCQAFHKPLNIEEMFQWLDDCSKRIKSERKLSNWAEKHDPISET